MNIEKLTGQVMANQTAADAYMALNCRVSEIADKYLSAKLRGDTALCLALELYARQIAISHFHLPEVNEMLSKVERYKAMRKPGTGAPKMLQDIANEIERAWKSGDFHALDDGRVRFHIGRLKVTCRGTNAGVALLAAKYRRGISYGKGKAR